MRQIILRLQSEIIDCSDDIFSIQTQEISSVSTNTLDENYESWAGPIRYQPEHNCKFVLPDILDNTEGIAAFADLRCPVNAKLWVDIGGGASDAPSKWLENKYPGLIVMVIDPFARSHEHNISIQIHLKSSGLADVVSSMSVLNVISNLENRLRHCLVMFNALKVGGTAYFKVWAGLWPLRGSGQAGI